MDVLATRPYFKKITVGLATAFVSLFLAGSASAASNVSFGGSPIDCDSNAVIRCGALTASDVTNDYNADAYVQKIYQAFGITNTDIQQLSTTAVAGTVTKSGEVLVNGKTVATGAITAGRTNMPGSTAVTANGITYYKRPPSVSFQQDSLDAYVVMGSNNQFRFAILASCGNPISAKPVAPPTPKASAECSALQLDKIDDRTYTATVITETTGGATLKSITYDFGDNTSIPPTKQTSMTHTYTQSGTYHVRADLTFNNASNASQSLTANCQAPLTIAPPPANTVSTPPKALPSTGPSNVIPLFLGTTMVGTLSWRAYLAKRLKMNE